jgi:hypothetical protein
VACRWFPCRKRARHDLAPGWLKRAIAFFSGLLAPAPPPTGDPALDETGPSLSTKGRRFRDFKQQLLSLPDNVLGYVLPKLWRDKELRARGEEIAAAAGTPLPPILTSAQAPELAAAGAVLGSIATYSAAFSRPGNTSDDVRHARQSLNAAIVGEGVTDEMAAAFNISAAQAQAARSLRQDMVNQLSGVSPAGPAFVPRTQRKDVFDPELAAQVRAHWRSDLLSNESAAMKDTHRFLCDSLIPEERAGAEPDKKDPK